jgi:tRNA(fMet)-specific endonuclease VapC
MGLILDSSLLIANERGKFDMPGFLRKFSSAQPLIAAITASELLHGVERAGDAVRKMKRQQHVEQILAVLSVQHLIWRKPASMPAFGRSLNSTGK